MSVTPVTLITRRTDEQIIADYEEMEEQAHANGWAHMRPCHNRPDLFADYKTSPSPAKAEAMCAGCPVLNEICRPYAEVIRPPWTVLGGISWVDKRPFQPTARELVTKIAA